MGDHRASRSDHGAQSGDLLRFVGKADLVLAVAIAASASFLTPISYQTNMMVYGPGGYRFGDYARLGMPLTVVVIALVALLLGGGR